MLNSYRGEDCMDWFANQISVIAIKLKTIIPMATDGIREKTIVKNVITVCNHCHCSGNFQGFVVKQAIFKTHLQKNHE